LACPQRQSLPIVNESLNAVAFKHACQRFVTGDALRTLICVFNAWRSAFQDQRIAPFRRGQSKAESYPSTHGVTQPVGSGNAQRVQHAQQVFYGAFHGVPRGLSWLGRCTVAKDVDGDDCVLIANSLS
jgi:hypothetical protein